MCQNDIKKAKWINLKQKTNASNTHHKMTKSKYADFECTHMKTIRPYDVSCSLEGLFSVCMDRNWDWRTVYWLMTDEPRDVSMFKPVALSVSGPSSRECPSRALRRRSAAWTVKAVWAETPSVLWVQILCIITKHECPADRAESMTSHCRKHWSLLSGTTRCLKVHLRQSEKYSESLRIN